MKSGTCLPYEILTKAGRDAFRAKFAQPAYNTFLRFVIKHFGTERFAGIMTTFHLNPTLLVRV